MSRHYLERKSNRYTTYTDAISVFNAHTSVRPDYSMDSISWDGWLCVSVRLRETNCGEEARIRVKWWSIYGTKSRAPLLRFIIYANHLRTINQIKIISFALKGHPTNPLIIVWFSIWHQCFIFQQNRHTNRFDMLCYMHRTVPNRNRAKSQRDKYTRQNPNTPIFCNTKIRIKTKSQEMNLYTHTHKHTQQSNIQEIRNTEIESLFEYTNVNANT